MERPLRAVPRVVIALLLLGLGLQIAWHFTLAEPTARAEPLPAPPPAPTLRLLSFGEPVVLAKLLTLYVQAHDVQPGVLLPLHSLDYDRLEAWLSRLVALDPRGQYPLLLASHIYGGVKDEARQRQMAEWVYRAFLDDPERRWPWLAHVAVMAKHRLRDLALAQRYARAIRQHAQGPDVPAWAQQMELFVLEEMNEIESAQILIGGLLASGRITDPHELRFLEQRLQALREKSSSADARPASTPNR